MPDTVLDRRGQIDASVVTAASELYAVTPTSRRLRVTGRLDVMGASQGVLKLDVRPSEIVTALWDGEEPVETLREFFNRDVVVEGVGVFRPSGSLLRVDADAIVPPRLKTSSFDEFPQPPLNAITTSWRGSRLARNPLTHSCAVACPAMSPTRTSTPRWLHCARRCPRPTCSIQPFYCTGRAIQPRPKRSTRTFNFHHRR